MKTTEKLIFEIDQYLLGEFFHGAPKDKNGGWDSWQSARNILTIIEQAGRLVPENPPHSEDKKIHQK